MSLWPGIVVVYGLALLALAICGLNHATLSVISRTGGGSGARLRPFACRPIPSSPFSCLYTTNCMLPSV